MWTRLMAPGRRRMPVACLAPRQQAESEMSEPLTLEIFSDYV